MEIFEPFGILFTNKKIITISLSIMFIFVVLGMILYDYSLLNIIRYIGFEFFFILFPGMLLYRLLRLKKSRLFKITFSYALGISFLIILYFIFFLLNIPWGLYYFGPVLSIIELLLFFKHKEFSLLRIPIDKNKFYLICLTVFLLIIMFFSFTLANPFPDQRGYGTYSQDQIWFVGNAQSLLRSFPPIDSRLSDVVFKYHYFDSIHLAVMSYVTKLETTLLYYRFSQIGKIFFMIFAVFLIGRKFLKSDRNALIFTFLYFFSNCASFFLNLKQEYGYFLNTNFNHLVYNPFGFELAIPFTFLLSIILLEQFTKKIEIKFLIVSAIFSFIITGLKGPIPLMILSVLFVMICIDLANRKYGACSSKTLYLFFIGVPFFVLYLFLLKTHSSNITPYYGFTIENSIFGMIFPVIKQNNLLKILLTPFHLFGFLPFFIIPFTLWIIKNIKSFREITDKAIFVSGVAICGIIANYVFMQDGNSQIYFILVAIPFIELGAFKYLIENSGTMKRTFKFFLQCLLIVSVFTSFFMLLKICGRSVLRTFEVLNFKMGNIVSELNSSFNLITLKEYEAMKWLKEHSDEKDVILTDRQFNNEKTEDPLSRFFFYSTFSNRQMFLEGWYYHFKERNEILDTKIDLVENFYSGKMKNLDEVKKQKIKYVIVSEFVNPDFEHYNEFLNLEYENDDIKVYRVL